MQNPDDSHKPTAPAPPLETASQQIAQADELVRADPRKWAEAVKILEDAIDTLAASPVEDAATKSQILAWARLGRGNILVNTNSRPHIEAALQSYEAALAELEAIETEHPQRAADLAAVLGNIGHARFRLGDPEQLAASETFYRRAIDILEKLDWKDTPRYRHQLATTYLNLANTLARLGKPAEPSEPAIAAFDKALECTAELAAEDDNMAVLRASIRSSLARALQWCADHQRLERAGREFEGAIRILEKLPYNEDQRLALELAACHANRATLISRAKPSKATIDATLQSGEVALQLAGPTEQSNLFAAETAINARRAICHTFGILVGSQEPQVKADIHDKATDLVEDGLKVIRLWESRAATGLRPSAQHLFHLGCAFYCLQQPQFLPEFVNDYLVPDDQVMRRSALSTLDQATKNPDLPLAPPVAQAIQAKLRELQP